MPSHPERVRTAPLPAGYQFGDAGKGDAFHRFGHLFGFETLRMTPPSTDAHFSRLYTDDFTNVKIGKSISFTFPSWRAPHLNAAEQLARRQFITDRDTGDER